MMNFHLGIAFKIADEWDIKQGSTLFFFFFIARGKGNFV